MHQLDAERAVLGSCIVSRKALTLVLGELQVEDFYSERHRFVFSAIKAAAREHDEIDHVLVSKYLSKENFENHKAFMFSLIEAMPHAANTREHIRMIRSAAMSRKGVEIAESLRFGIEQGESDTESLLMRTMRSVENAVRKVSTTEEVTQFRGVIDELETWLTESRSHEGVSGIRTGLHRLDRSTGGLNKQRYYIIAGRPGSGKSLLCGQIGLSAARQGYRALLITPEMSKFDYFRRLCIAAANVDASGANRGDISAEEDSEILRQGLAIADLPFFVSAASRITVEDIRRACLRYEPDLLLVDYLQRLAPSDRRVSKYEQVMEISFEVDRLKKDFDIPVVAAAQLNRSTEARTNQHPQLSDLRDSGTIEQDADFVGMVHRPGHYDHDEPEELMDLFVRKSRHGELGNVKLWVQPSLWIADRNVYDSGPVRHGEPH